MKINIFDFGAKGDGKSDDGKAFEKAIAHLKKKTGVEKILEVPKGKYLFFNRSNEDESSNVYWVSTEVIYKLKPNDL